jgi:hypothetical protein
LLTIIDSLSLAGDRAKQNDDAHGVLGRFAWVIDGATDLHGAPLSAAATDAAWFAHMFNAALYGAGATATEAKSLLARAHAETVRMWDEAAAPITQAWQSPTASIVMMEQTATGLSAYDLGDSRLFVQDASGQAHAFGGGKESAKDEVSQVRIVTRGHTQRPLDRSEVIEELRRRRALANVEGGYFVLGLAPVCLAHMRDVTFELALPAYCLLATDGFSALVDRYEAYSAGGLVQAALERGLAALGQELRAIEANDADGALHPRWKSSDDATAVLVRLD